MLMRHIKSGRIYRIQMLATEEATVSPVVVYACALTGHVWVRPAKEFFDGRFEVYVGAGHDEEFTGVIQ